MGSQSRTRLSDFTFTFTFMHWRRQWQPTPVFLPGESQGRGSLVGCRLWGRTESDTAEATQQQEHSHKSGRHVGPRPPSPALMCCGAQLCSRCKMFFPGVLPFPGDDDEQTSQWGIIAQAEHQADLTWGSQLFRVVWKPASQCLETIRPQGSCISLCLWGRGCDEVKPVVPLKAHLGCAPLLSIGGAGLVSLRLRTGPQGPFQMFAHSVQVLLCL